MKTQDLEKIKLDLRRHNNGPIVESGYVVERAERLAAVSLSMRDKWCEIDGIGSDENCLPSLYLLAKSDQEIPEHDNVTEVTFPEFQGWDIWSYSVGKYHVNICLVKRDYEVI